MLPIVAVGLVGLLLAMEDRAPLNLYSWLWSLPGFSSIRAPVRYTLIFELMMALLVAIILDRIRQGPAAWSGRIVALALAGFVIVLVAGGDATGCAWGGGAVGTTFGTAVAALVGAGTGADAHALKSAAPDPTAATCRK